MATVDALPPGTVLLDKYRIGKPLGSGGMSVVYEATHLQLGQRVAIKLLHPELSGNAEHLARFVREARAAATLPSEHVARVTDAGQTEQGTPYLVMELLEGRDLADELARKGRLPVAAAVDLVLEACEGLAEAHARGLVHRDIKPSNLFLAERKGRAPVVKVLDFGLIKAAPGSEHVSLTQPESVFGTPQYMAPEQVLSTKNVDARCDQHALGMVLFEALTGRPPYQGVSPSQLFVIIATAPAPSARAIRHDVPAALDAAILRAMAKRPEQRHESLAAFAAAIAPFGGREAREKAENVARALSSSAAVSGDMDERSTIRREVSNTDLTSSMDPVKRARRARRAAIAGVSAIGVVAGVGIAATLSAVLRSAPGAGASAHAVAEAPVSAAPSSASLPVPAAPGTAASAGTSGDGAAGEAASAEPPEPAPPPAVPSSSASRGRARGPSRTAPPSSGVRKAIGVFGDKR